MTSSIDPTKPTAVVALTADVRANFSAAKTEIEALQATATSVFAEKTGNFTAAAGGRYLCNTSSAGFTATLPIAPTVNDRVEFIDAARSWATHNLTIARNSEKIGLLAENMACNVNGGSFALVYTGSTNGWEFAT